MENNNDTVMNDVLNIKKYKRCNTKTEVYSRVCGFFRPVSNYNKGKEQEFKERNFYKA